MVTIFSEVLVPGVSEPVSSWALHQLIYRGRKKNVSSRLENLALLVETLLSSIFRSDGNPISNQMVAW